MTAKQGVVADEWSTCDDKNERGPALGPQGRSVTDGHAANPDATAISAPSTTTTRHTAQTWIVAAEPAIAAAISNRATTTTRSSPAMPMGIAGVMGNFVFTVFTVDPSEKIVTSRLGRLCRRTKRRDGQCGRACRNAETENETPSSRIERGWLGLSAEQPGQFEQRHRMSPCGVPLTAFLTASCALAWVLRPFNAIKPHRTPSVRRHTKRDDEATLFRNGIPVDRLLIT